MSARPFSKAEIKRFRQETSGVAHHIHFNNAGAALMPDSVRDVMLDYLQEESLNGGYETAATWLDKTEAVYPAIAKLIGAETEEIAILENATAAWHAAFHSISWKPGDEVLTTEVSYASNFLSFLQAKKRYGIEIRVANKDESGRVDVEDLAQKINSQTRLIALTHVPTNGGLINPAARVGDLANAHQIPFLLDACQSVGQLRIDVKDIGCDFLSATGRKYLRGPRGTGFLYVRSGIMDQIEPPSIDLHAATWQSPDSYVWRSDARRFETWESSLALKVGLAEAVTYAYAIGMDRIADRVKRLAGQFRKQLEGIPGVRVHDLGTEQSGIVSLSKAGIEAAHMRDKLYGRKINTAVIFPNGTLLDSLTRNLPFMLRASVHYYNTEDELDIFCEALEAL